MTSTADINDNTSMEICPTVKALIACIDGRHCNFKDILAFIL
jgi:hypothetical protein